MREHRISDWLTAAVQLVDARLVLTWRTELVGIAGQDNSTALFAGRIKSDDGIITRLLDTR